MLNQQFRRNNHTNEGKIARVRMALASVVDFEPTSLEIRNPIFLFDEPWVAELNHEDAVFEGFIFSEGTDEQGTVEDFSFSIKILKALIPKKFRSFWKLINKRSLVIEFLNFNDNKRCIGPVQASYSLKQPDNFFEGEYYQIIFKPARVYDYVIHGEIIDSTTVECQTT